ncbi:MAG TPA: glycosyltransferase [Thermodesulfobacteriota bacterium]|nr:glycosyltransferase [Thermodesulfobacteriota bacterium]
MPPTWPLDPARLRGVRVRWPAVYEWPPARLWVEPIRQGLARHVPVEPAPVAQPYKGIVLFELVAGGRLLDVAIDYADHPRVDERCVQRVGLYFKMQYLADGYRWPHVLPGGYVPRSPRLYRYLPRLRALRDRRPPRLDVYGRFGVQFAGDLRRRVVERLAADPRFRYGGGLGLVRYSRSLREAARAKVCIDLPGKGDLCFRLIEYLAIGACVIGPPHRTRLHVPLTAGTHLVYARADLADLTDLCVRYLERDDLRERLYRASREFFDRYLHRDQLAAYYLHCGLEQAGR